MSNPRLSMLTLACFALALLAMSPILVASRGGGEIPRPLVVAHRGASGYLPELTLPAFTLAHAQGADLIETDVQLTKDGVLINLHDLTLNRTTNVEEVFPDRARADGKFWAIDFTLAEIRSLAIDGPTKRFEDQLPGGLPGGLRISTLDELMELIQMLNRTTGRDVQLLVEVKDPEFHRREGKPIEKPVLETLARHGIEAPGQGAVIQSFGGEFLRRLRQEHDTTLPLYWLFGDEPETLDLETAAQWLDGVAPSRKRLEKEGVKLVDQAESLGLGIFCWTFQDDPAVVEQFARTYRLDGVITDFPDIALEVVGRGGHQGGHGEHGDRND